MVGFITFSSLIIDDLSIRFCLAHPKDPSVLKIVGEQIHYYEEKTLRQ